MLKRTLYLLLLAIVLAGCAGSPAQRAVADVQALLDKGRTYYNGGVTRETNITNLERKFELSMNTFRTTAHDLIANKASCFTDVAAAESTIAEAVMGTTSEEALINALVTQSVSGEGATSICANLNVQLADFVIASRPAVQDAQLAAFEAGTEYMQYTSAFPEVDIMNDLLQTYGDTALVYQKLADAGVGVTDWSWLPTSNLWVAHRDENLCRYYMSGAFMENVSYSTKLKFTGHEDALARLYESAWNPAANGGAGECRMTRYAALEYITRSIVSSDTSDILINGEDQGIFPTDTPVP